MTQFYLSSTYKGAPPGYILSAFEFKNNPKVTLGFRAPVPTTLVSVFRVGSWFWRLLGC
jgi:hypothetical protein